MSEVKFSKEHEWIKLEGDVATIGITFDSGLIPTLSFFTPNVICFFIISDPG